MAGQSVGQRIDEQADFQQKVSFFPAISKFPKFEVEAIIVPIVEHMCLDNQTKLTVTMKTALCSSFFASLQRGSDFKEDALAISEQSWPSLS
jgi:hypothetical protein